MIPLSKENLTVDVFSGVIPNGEILVKIYCKDSVIGLEQREEILQAIQKTKLFDSLLVENQTILDTISQVKIANAMYEQQNKELKEKFHELIGTALEFKESINPLYVEELEKELQK